MRPASFDPESETRVPKTRKTMFDPAKYLWPEGRTDLKIRLVFAMGFLLGAKIINIYVPYLLKLTIDKFTLTEGALVLPLGLIAAYGLARVGVSLFGEFRDLLFIKVIQNAQRAVSLFTFKHLHALSLDFHLSRQTGGLSRIIQRGTRGIQFVLRFLTFNIVPTLLEIAMVAGVLVYNFDYIYAVIILVTIVSYISATLYITEWRLKYRKRMNSEESKANTSAIDSLLNYETVKYFGNEEHEHQRFDTFLAAYESAAIQSQASLSFLNILQTSIIGLGLVAILLKAGNGVVDGSMTVGDFVLVNTYMIQLYLPLNFLGFVYREVKNSLVDMEKMFELAEVEASITDAPDAPNLQDAPMDVEFKDVHFSYNSDRNILNGVSFYIPAGKHLAIVGASGAGKSTIARLLFRFYDTSAGQILVGGNDVKQVSQKSLRSRIGVVPQDTVLFNDTIGYNINYGNPKANDVISAASHAQIHDFVESLPKGYNTQVGERGLKLSGGERQRVSIARAILKKPRILLFDEATSSLDSHTEQEILTALRKVSKGYTTLTIAHRLSTVVDADEIIVLDKGQVVERGSHEGLLQQSGAYKALWDEQVQEKQETPQ